MFYCIAKIDDTKFEKVCFSKFTYLDKLFLNVS